MKEIPTTVGELAQIYANNSARELPSASRRLRRNLTGRFLVERGAEENLLTHETVRDELGGAFGPSENPDWSSVAAPELTAIGTLAYKYGTEPLRRIRNVGALILPRETVEDAEAAGYYARRKQIGVFNAEVRSGQRQVTVYEGKSH